MILPGAFQPFPPSGRLSYGPTRAFLRRICWQFVREPAHFRGFYYRPPISTLSRIKPENRQNAPYPPERGRPSSVQQSRTAFVEKERRQQYVLRKVQPR